MQRIQSRDNPLVRRIKRITESARARREDGHCVLDGAHLLAAALDAGRYPETVVVAEGATTHAEVAALLARCPDDTLRVVPDGLFAQLSPVATPVGVLALLPLPAPEGEPDPACDWMVLDGVQDAGNLGTMIRTAAAAGLAHIVLGPGCAQVWSPKVLRAAMGAHFVVALHEVADLPAALRGHTGQVRVTRLDGARSLFEQDLRGPTAWVFGGEGQGVSAEVAACADAGVFIPMTAGVESLNVAAAAAICLFEQRRQRGG